ncbi:MAG: methyltransferase domain-containing protein [Rhodospirillales bacterium]
MPNTALHQSHSTETDFHFDISTYFLCKEVLKGKDRRLALTLRDVIADTFFSTGLPVVDLLDVGGGDGSFIERVLRDVHEIAIESRLDCIEPDPDCYNILMRSKPTLGALGADVKFFNSRVEDFLESGERPDGYHVVMFTHLLYHIERKHWPALIRRALGRLKDNGRLIVIMVSRKSQIYRLWDRIEETCGTDGVRRNIDMQRHGAWVFSEDLQVALDDAGIRYSKEYVGGPIVFRQTRLKEDRMFIAEEAPEKTNLARFLAFMFRTTPADVARCLYDEIREYSCRLAPLHFQSIDGFYVIEKQEN